MDCGSASSMRRVVDQRNWKPDLRGRMSAEKAAGKSPSATSGAA
ncbi:hypothetical protein PAMC26577_12905 [Caballeronia sordidicola]|uniref:Uncharacterized protein n=1 Tax=Caballeronia sordidicola TaxID=196367 RepID=A0A242MX16_CABSO|nr:hypothetical protein PAMC26577_12905 [Caballeronia sordidicola]